jgi:hypothetical protein
VRRFGAGWVFGLAHAHAVRETSAATAATARTPR